MWKTVYYQNGKEAPSSEAFFEALRTDHQTVVKVELLDTSFLPIEGGTVFSTSNTKTNDVSNLVSDGNIDVDKTRGTRRTAELTLLNPSAEFTPATEDFSSDGPWVGKIYLNRMVRIWRGVYVNSQPLYVPVGTFMIDVCDVLFEQNMSLVNLTMSDRWKMLAKSYFDEPVTYAADTTYNTIINDFIIAAGIPVEGKHAAVIDPLGTRDAADRKISHRLKFERGDSRGDKLKELCDKWNIDIYFDPMGALRTEDRRRARDRQQVWQFFSSDTRRGMLTSIKRTFNDSSLYNHVVIVGTGDPKNAVVARRKNSDADSKWGINSIGDRVYIKESSRISTEAEARKALDRAWELRLQFSEQLECNTVCNPALEADDVIRITENTFVKVDDKYRLTRFNIPLVTTRQTIQAMNIIKREDYL